MSMPGIQAVATRATLETLARSESRAFPAPGYWIFTATSRPSRQVARCTCPIEAAAIAVSSKEVNRLRQRGPSSAAMTSLTLAGGRAGALSCNLVSIAR